MPLDLSFVLYDTVAMGNVAAVETILFQTPQGADATHTELFTNSRGGGVLPPNETFKIKRVHVAPDFNGVTADYQQVYVNSFLAVLVNNREMLKAPLFMFASQASFGGLYTQGAPAAEALIGLQGDGFGLDIPIVIPKGVVFKVRVFQGTALSAVGQNVKVLLEGVLTSDS